MTNKDNCPFCNKERIMSTLPTKRNGSLPCNHAIYKGDFCFAVLAFEQLTIGHTLVILNEHKTDITDDISSDHLSAFIADIHRVSRQLMEFAENERQERPEKIYVCTLSDGVKHLHAHLIPRYPFTKSDIKIYREKFAPRDGEKIVRHAIENKELGGYWYIAEREAKGKKSNYGRKSVAKKAVFLEELANKLRIPQGCANEI